MEEESFRNESQEEILNLLKYAPQAAITLMVKQYTGLIWKVAGQYLSNPEDIKECVNDTFMEFYCHQDRFDVTRGSLPKFLITITRNRAISKYRKNKLHENFALTDEIPYNIDDIEQAELKLDLERVLSSLKPEDEEMIRMKYYDGMTVQEIARSLNLPYETVKKRQQRSLSKLRRLFLACLLVLLIASLTACAYMVLRYFGIIPGYGINTKPEKQVYTLLEEISLETECGQCVLQDALIMEDSIWLWGTYHFDREEDLWNMISELADISDVPFQLKYDGNIYSYGIMWSVGDGSLEFSLHEVDDSLAEVLSVSQAQLAEITFIWWDMEIPFVMKCESEGSLSSYSYLLGENGGLMALPHLEQTELIVDIYPLNTSEASIAPCLIRDKYMQGQTDNITLISEDGSKLIGEWFYEPIHSDFFSRWNFGAVPPGDYVLHVPYLYLTVPWEETAIYIDLSTCQWEDKEYKIWDGTLSVVSCEQIEENMEEILSKAGLPLLENCSYWQIEIFYQKDGKEHSDLELADFGLLSKPSYAEGVEQSYNLRGCSLQSVSEDGYRQYIVYLQGSGLDLTRFYMVTSDEIVLRWAHSFDFPIRVEQ